MKHNWKTDCRGFLGVQACDTLKFENYVSCEDCKFHDPINNKILIIKLGASGDVIRTTTILKALKKKYSNCHITWLVDEESVEVLKNNNLVDRILIYNFDNVLRLKHEKFDVLFSLEVDVPGSAIANVVNSEEKFGYYLAEDGFPKSFKESGDYYLERVFSDHINKTNTKTYPEMIFEICELPYNKEKYILKVSDYSKQYAEKLLSLDKNKKTIGINIGSGGRFPSRMIPKDKIIELVKKLQINYNVILLSGSRESGSQQEIKKKLGKEGLAVFKNEPSNTKEEFIGVVNLCDYIIVGDSLAMHIAIGLDKKVVALFFCTPSNEIEDYGIVTKLVSLLCEKYFYTDEYSLDLLNSISVDDIIKAID